MVFIFDWGREGGVVIVVGYVGFTLWLGWGGGMGWGCERGWRLGEWGGLVGGVDMGYGASAC